MKNLLILLSILISKTIFGQTTILGENFGKPSSNITCSSYNKWQNASLYKYETSDISPEIKIDYKSSGYINASGGGNLSFEGGVYQYLDISGINTIGYSNLSISFYTIKLDKEIDNHEISILISDNGSKFRELVIDKEPIDSRYSRQVIESDIPNSKNLKIRILYVPSNKNTKIRIDDFKLTGCLIPKVPSVYYKPTACMFEVLNLPSNTFIQTSPTGIEMNPVAVILNSGYYYIRTVSTSLGCSSVWSQPEKFYVNVRKLPSITKNPITSIAIYNNSTTYKFIANADTTFYWEVSKDNGLNWIEVEDKSPYRINNDTLEINFTKEVKNFNGYQYRISTYGTTCRVSSTAGTLFIPESSTDNIISLYADEFFTAINVYWSTYKEKNIEKYSIERSDYDMNWVEIGSVPAMHNTNGKYNYSFYDNFTSLNFSVLYRIKIVKEDNTVSYSPIVTVTKANDEPSKKYFSLLGNEVLTLERDTYYIEVIDGQAKRVILTN